MLIRQVLNWQPVRQVVSIKSCDIYWKLWIWLRFSRQFADFVNQGADLWITDEFILARFELTLMLATRQVYSDEAVRNCEVWESGPIWLRGKHLVKLDCNLQVLAEFPAKTRTCGEWAWLGSKLVSPEIRELSRPILELVSVGRTSAEINVNNDAGHYSVFLEFIAGRLYDSVKTHISKNISDKPEWQIYPACIAPIEFNPSDSVLVIKNSEFRLPRSAELTCYSDGCVTVQTVPHIRTIYRINQQVSIESKCFGAWIFNARTVRHLNSLEEFDIAHSELVFCYNKCLVYKRIQGKLILHSIIQTD